MKYQDRDLSWLSFNERILQEAANPQVPLMERLKFIAIYSSNLEEFYKVRVASHRFAQKYRGDKKNKFGFRPSYILNQINLIVSTQQERLGKIFGEEILPGLSKEGIHLINEPETEEDRQLIAAYYDAHLHGQFSLVEITDADVLELKNQAVYLYLIHQNRSYLLELDYKKFGRFISLKQDSSEHRIMQLDDILKLNVGRFLDEEAEVFAVKISRDAELYIDEEQDNDIVKKIKKSIRKRDSGLPARLLFDEQISFRHINALRRKMGLDMVSLVAGGRYHNFYDFFGFPADKSKSHLFSQKVEKIPAERLTKGEDWFSEIREMPVFLSFPYQDYDYVPQFLHQAAADPNVEEINITLYRVASDSEVCQALEIAAKQGKKVFVLTEVQARFDEESNIYWGQRLEQAGATVMYGVPNLKVHAKIFAVKRREGKEVVTYSYLGTGNFNEKTAGIYGDHALLTTDEAIAKDLSEIFRYIRDTSYHPRIKTLLVAPFTLRKTFASHIKNEIALAKAGKGGKITLKLNSLEDVEMIDRIRKAADAGVKIDMVIRGICCYEPLTDAQRENVKVVSIVDQFLEHTRIYHFNNNDNPQTYLGSADWMTRNLSKRIEVAFPVQDSQLQTFLIDQMDLQLHDSVKGRLIACEEENTFVSGEQTQSAQEQMFSLVKRLEASRSKVGL